jgi:hypothetical protein
MSFFDLKMLKGKPTKFKKIKLLKIYAFGTKKFKKKKKIVIHMNL